MTDFNFPSSGDYAFSVILDLRHEVAALRAEIAEVRKVAEEALASANARAAVVEKL